MPQPAEEGRQRSGPGPWWIEWWELVFWAQDSSLAGSVRLTLVPGAQRAWYWADLVGGYDAGKAVMYRRFQLEQGDLLDFFRRVYFWVETLALVGRVPAKLPTEPAAA